jgi:hypothetical protein
MTLGITDLGTEMFVRMTVNAAAQSGAAYAAINAASCGSPTLSASCVSSIKQAMSDATDANFCSQASCGATSNVCTDATSASESPASQCITVTADYPFTRILPTSLYSTTPPSLTVSSTSTIRVK